MNSLVKNEIKEEKLDVLRNALLSMTISDLFDYESILNTLIKMEPFSFFKTCS